MKGSQTGFGFGFGLDTGFDNNGGGVKAGFDMAPGQSMDQGFSLGGFDTGFGFDAGFDSDMGFGFDAGFDAGF